MTRHVRGQAHSGGPRMPAPCRSELQRLRPAGVEHEDLTVADAAGSGAAHDTIGHLLRAGVAHPDADLDLGQERHAVLAAEITVEVALLPAIALGLLHHAGDNVQPGDGPEYPFGAERFD